MTNDYIPLTGCTENDVRALQDRLKAAEDSDAESIAMYRRARDERDALKAENQQLRKAISDLIADLEYEGSDGWMTGQVHSDEYKAAKALLENTNGTC